jgi:hypothetical protein
MTSDDHKWFLSKDVYEPGGTLEERWGPQGYLVCTTCDVYHVCNKMAADPIFYTQGPCRECGNSFVWVEKYSFEEANPKIFGDRE